jgi:YD repeat-containing protein
MPRGRERVIRRLALAFALSCAVGSTAEAASCFTYDELGRIIEATYENGTKFTYSYDPNGNRTTTSVQTGQTPTCPDPGGYGENHPPVAVADSSTARPTIVQVIDVRANDSEPDGDPITLSQVTTPAKGTAVIANGKVEYTANSGATGTDSFSYTIIDGRGGSANTTVSITAFVANSAPVAVTESATVAPTVATTLSVRANDTDADGDNLTISNVSTPSKGTTSISSGNIVYTANANTTGTDSFNYTVIDGYGGTSSVTDTITINRPPVAVADSASAAPTVAATINVRANDTDPDNDTLTVAGTTTPTKGTANVSNNNVAYTANAGTSGTDNFDYTVADGKGGSASATVTVTISNNQPPVAVNDSILVELFMSNFTTFDPRFNDSDPNGNPLTITDKTNGEHGTVTILSGGTLLKYTFTGWTPEFAIMDEFTYTISDGQGGSATATVYVEIWP